MLGVAATKARKAFTLLELLVVVAIIAVLAALAATGTLRIIEAQNENNTRTAIQAVYPILHKQWAKVVADAKKETPSDAVQELAKDLNGFNPLRAQVIWVKLRLMEAFPINYSEIETPPCYQTYSGSDLIPAGQRRYMANYGTNLKSSSWRSSWSNLTTYNRNDVVMFANTFYVSLVDSNTGFQPDPTPSSTSQWKHDPVGPNAACLVMALSVNRGGVVLDPEKLGPFLRDSDNDGLAELVDGWGNPIAFFRFPTNNDNLQGLKPAFGRAATFASPLDPDGTLMDSSWGAGQAFFTSFVHQVYWKGNNAQGIYIIPALVSAGQDGRLGLTVHKDSAMSDMSVSNANDSYDNIYSFFSKIGATGN